MTDSAFRRNAARQLYVEQGADDILDYGVDAVDLFPAGDTIDSAVWVAADGVTITAPQTDGMVASAFVAGTSGSATVTVTSIGGRRKRVDFLVQPPIPPAA